jgi:FlaG/FlaF family flagellin (archaellin)
LAGRKGFVAGEILTAADVNSFLMDQSVMVFDDSTARGSAIPTPSEGMVTYLKDSDQLFKYTTDWVPAGGLVATKSVLKTNTFSASVTAGNNVAVTDLSITHTLQSASNKLIISAYFGVAGTTAGRAQIGLAVADDGTLVGVGGTDGSRSSVGAGGRVSIDGSSVLSNNYALTFVYEPGDTVSHTYTVRAINIDNVTQTLYVNRREDDQNGAFVPRGSSALVIQEVAV